MLKMEKFQLLLEAAGCTNIEVICGSARRSQLKSLAHWVVTVDSHVGGAPESDILKRPFARPHLSSAEGREQSLHLRAFFWAWCVDIHTGQWIRERIRSELSLNDEIGELFADLCLGAGPRTHTDLLILPACSDCGAPTGSWCDGCEDDPHRELLTLYGTPSVKFLRPFCTKCEKRKGNCGICSFWPQSWEIEKTANLRIQSRVAEISQPPPDGRRRRGGARSPERL